MISSVAISCCIALVTWALLSTSAASMMLDSHSDHVKLGSKLEHEEILYPDYQEYLGLKPPPAVLHDLPESLEHMSWHLINEYQARDITNEHMSWDHTNRSLVIDQKQKRKKRQRWHTRRKNGSQHNYSTSPLMTFVANPFSYIRQTWNEAWGGTSRLMSSSNVGYVWAVPLAGMFLYDLFVPKIVRVRRSLGQSDVMQNLSYVDEAFQTVNRLLSERRHDKQDTSLGSKDGAWGVTAQCKRIEKACYLSRWIRMKTSGMERLVMIWLEQQSPALRRSQVYKAFTDGLAGNSCGKWTCP